MSEPHCPVCSGPRFLCGGCPLGVPRGLVAVPSLPRKVRHGEDLVAGHWYRIVEIDPHDRDPSLKVGDLLMASGELRPGFIDPENHAADGMGTQWFADFGGGAGEDDDAYRTLVNELEEVEAPT